MDKLKTIADYEFLLLKDTLRRSGCEKKQIAAGCYVKGKGFVYATNHCDHEGDVCPRMDMPSGEGYELCMATHAESNLATMVRGEELKSEIAWVFGHYYACEPCAAALKAVGIKEIRVRERM